MSTNTKKIKIADGPAEKSLQKAYSDAIKFLNQNYAYFVTHVLNTGKPVLNPAIPTACVFFNEDTQKTEFHIGREMLKLTTEQFAFVISHETMHAHLNHVHFLGKLARVAKGTQVKDVTHEQRHGLEKANVAADAVINDYLWSRGLDLPDWVMTGDKVVGHECSSCTVKEVFDEMDDPQCTGEGQDGDGDITIIIGDPGDGEGGGGGSMPCGMSPKVREAIEKFLEENPQYKGAGQGTKMDKDLDIADGQGQTAGNFPTSVDQMNKDSSAQVAQGVTAGFGTSNELTSWAKDTSTSLKWMELLKEINPDMFRFNGIGKKTPMDFHKRSRKMHHSSMREISLPVPAARKSRKIGPTDEIPLICLALDTSGSIRQEDAQRFITLAKSIPTKHIKLWVTTFTSSYRELDLENPQWNSGGTDFSAIEDFIQMKMKEQNKPYPKAVVAITDGEANFGSSKVPAEKEGNWTWLLTDDGTSHYIKIGEIKALKDYIS